MRPVALVTARAARGLDEDEVPLVSALRAAGIEVEIADWDSPGVDWASFGLAILRSTWDYTDRLDDFLAWVRTVDGQTTLLNPAAVVRWNTDKHYLAQLAKQGVPTVPSLFVEPGDNASRSLDRFLAGHREPELVVKPAVGAGSRDTQRYERHQQDLVAAHIQRLLDAQRSVLLQPYLDRVDDDGETALIFIGGRFSHAIRKGPMLPPGRAGGPGAAAAAGTPPGGASQALFVAERITPRVAAADELHVAATALAAIPFTDLLYARVDLIRDPQGAPVLLELELTEPSLFFAYAEDSAASFAAAVRSRTSSVG